jgi:RHS repeat-associated protein
MTVFDTVVDGLLETSGIDSLGRTIRLREDALGRWRVHVDGKDNVETRSLDPVGNVISERAANGVGQDCEFDGLRQRLNCTDTQGDTTTWTYDSAGNVVSTTDATGVRTSCEFDRRNRRRRCVDGVGASTSWAHDGNSNITSITDGEGGVTSYAYDARDLRTTETYPDSTGPNDRVVNTFDAASRLVSRKDQGGGGVMFTYDIADRRIEKRDPEGDVDSFEYDAADRLVRGSSQRYGTTITRTFDGAGRLAAESLRASVTGPTYVVTYSYDVADEVSGLGYPDGSVVNRTYDSRKLLETISRGSTPVATFAYDGGGRLTETTFGNGLVEQRSYRSDRTVGAIFTPGVGDLVYSYDADKRKLSESGTAINGAQSFSYDNQGRLTNWSGPGSTQSWVLSLVGDWQTTTRNSVVEVRTHDAAHELTALGGNPLTYDARGNLVADDIGRILVWDFDNRLRSYSRGAVQATYGYDVLGRRVARTEGESTTVFVHAGDEVIAEYVDGDQRVSYILGGEIDRPVAFAAAGALFWYSANPLGTTAAVSGSAGDILERYRYDAYGARTVLSPSGEVLPSSAIGNVVGFTGRPHDGDLVDFRFRQYDPRLGRFVSRDDDYRDGMLSLYGAYFVPNATDPTGHALLSCGEGPELAVMALSSNEAQLIAPTKTVVQAARCPRAQTLFSRLHDGWRQGGICDLGVDVAGLTGPKIVASLPPRPDPWPPYPPPDPGDDRFPKTGCETCSPGMEGVPPTCVSATPGSGATKECRIVNRLCRDSGVCVGKGLGFSFLSFFDWWW